MFNLDLIDHNNNGDYMNILITGATSGIGFDTGVELIKRGHFVYFTVHRQLQVKTVVDKLKELDLLESASVFQLDVTNHEDRKLIYDLDVDCLVVNGAVGYGGSVLDIPLSSLKKNFDVNVFSNIKLIQMYCGHLFLEKKKGKVVVISSLAGVAPIPFLGSYCSTKASLSSLTTCLKKELGLITDDIKIKLIEPGIFNTGFNDVMIENRNDSIYFGDLEPGLTEIEKSIFNLVGHNSNKCAVKLIMRAIESCSNKLVYSGPFFQKWMARFYSFFR